MKFVISKYKEDISWVKDISSYIVYNKDESNINEEYVNIPNIGREAHTYLYHIITNYDKLDDLTCFLQGNPFDHLVVPLSHIENIKIDGYLPICRIETCDINGGPQNPYLEMDKVFFSKYFLNKPQFINYSTGAQFIVSRETILNRSKEFYENVLEDFKRTDIPERLSMLFGKDVDPHAFEYFKEVGDTNRMPWLLERVWSIIFDKNYKTIYDI
jgi:hypothetical protein